MPGDSTEEGQDNGPRMNAGGFVQFHDRLDHARSAMDFQGAKEMSLKKSPLRREYSLTDMLGEVEVKDNK